MRAKLKPVHWIEHAQLKGQPVVFDPSGAMWLPALKTLVVADLHFEKGSHYGRKGIFLPPYDTRATLDALEKVIARYHPTSILSLGDAFHDPEAEQRMDAEDADRLQRLCEGHHWIWVLGNHDPYPPQRFSGQVCEYIDLGGMLFVHEPNERQGWNVAGHLHPCAAAVHEKRRFRRPCFVNDGERLVMPAFGAYTGGLNILDEAFADVFNPNVSVHLLGKERVYQVPPHALRPDREAHSNRQRAAEKSASAS